MAPKIPETDDFVHVVKRAEINKPEAHEYRVVSKFPLVRVDATPPATLLLIQPLLSGFDMTQPDQPRPFAVYDSEFWDIFCLPESKA